VGKIIDGPRRTGYHAIRYHRCWPRRVADCAGARRQRPSGHPDRRRPGDGSLEGTLQKAHLNTADAVGALTGDLNDNFAACMIANEHGCRTVMRIDEDYREDIYRKYADEVDEVIYPERLGAIVAKNAMLGGNIRAIADIAQNLQLVEFTITQDSPMKGYSISELELPGETRLLAFGKRDGPLRLPTPDETLELGDRLVILAAFDKLGDIRSLVVGETGRAAIGGV
jgi:trk system potassium uptake protein TrkA